MTPDAPNPPSDPITPGPGALPPFFSGSGPAGVPPGMPPGIPPEARPRNPILVLVGVAGGIFMGFTGGSFLAVMIFSFMTELKLGIAPFVVVGLAAMLLPLVVILGPRRPRAPAAIGLLVGLSLAGLLMSACGIFVR